MFWTNWAFHKKLYYPRWGYRFSADFHGGSILVFLVPFGNSALFFVLNPYGISTFLSHTLWKFHSPQSKTSKTFRILRFNQFCIPKRGILNFFWKSLVYCFIAFCLVHSNSINCTCNLRYRDCPNWTSHGPGPREGYLTNASLGNTLVVLQRKIQN